MPFLAVAVMELEKQAFLDAEAVKPGLVQFLVLRPVLTPLRRRLKTSGG